MRPFRIEYTKNEVDDLHRRLDATRWPALPFDTGWSSGTNDQVLRELVRYWRHEYDWLEIQEQLNQLTHLRGPIEGEELHCVVYKGSGGDRRPPLLLLHGWPGSFVEFLDAAEMIAHGIDGQPGFDLVVPSLPGFGLSEAPRTPGMHAGRIAERMHGLMKELGYQRYGVQGGDWGAIIATALALQQPDSVAGLHITFVHPPRPFRREGLPLRRNAIILPVAKSLTQRRQATARSRGRDLRHWLTPRWILLSVCWPGSSRNSGLGVTTETICGRRSTGTDS